MASETNTRYFIAKCANIQSLQTCINNSRWACKDRVTSPPHPREILSSAFQNSGMVIILFSVNNCHGWHGYVKMLSPPSLGQNKSECNENSPSHTLGEGDLVEKDNLTKISLVKNNDESPWCYFNVKWVTEYMSWFGEQCLPFQKTTSLYCVDNTPLNKARNWNEVDSSTGQQLCALMDEHYEKLQHKHQEKIKLQESKLPPPFMKPVCNIDNFSENWSQLVKKVENELGPVLLACPFGSQRYNLDTENSDMDMFVIYQSETKALLCFDKEPPQTVKSSDRELLDYTVHEVHRYGELLLAGDHRCVETLFLHDTSYIKSSDALEQLIQKRNLFLNSLCLDKYLRDALGNKGFKLFEKWIKDKPNDEQMTDRECKLAYIIIRLLQNAKNIVDCKSLQVYRADDSDERKFLMSLKTQEHQPKIQVALQEINRLKIYIDDNKGNVPDASKEVREFMNEWILNLRKNNFM